MKVNQKVSDEELEQAKQWLFVLGLMFGGLLILLYLCVMLQEGVLDNWIVNTYACVWMIIIVFTCAIDLGKEE